jgi:hypothetical protein
MSTYNALGSAIYSKLTGGTALTALLSGTGAVYLDQAPDNGTLPYVIYNLMAGGPSNIYPHDLRSLVYQVRGYSGTQLAAGNIDKQCSLLLHKQALTVTGYTNIWTVRETDIVLNENTPSGEIIYSAGALYRINLDV